jgi:hypothetical protein
VHAADTLARRYRWILSTSWPPELILQIGRLTRADGSRRNDVDRRILSYYRANNWAELGAAVTQAISTAH